LTKYRWPVLPFSARMRAALFSFAFSLLISVPVLLFVYDRTDKLFEGRVRDRVDDRERNLMYGYRAGGVRGLTLAINQEVQTGVARGGAILLVDRTGRRVAGNIGSWPPTLQPTADWVEMRLYPEGSSEPVLFALRTLRLPTGERLLLGSNLEDRERMRDSLFEALVGALLLAIALGLVGGLFVLRFSERQARAVARVAERIAAGDFSHRVDAAGEGEEFGRVSDAINAMLERIEELVEQLRLVTDSLAHDLRSPLTRMRANLEKAAYHATAEPEQQALEAIATDIDRVMRLISATLEIGRAEAGVGREEFSDFDLVDLLRSICEIYQPIAEEKEVSLEVETPGSVPYRGNRQLIGRAVANLVENALKYGSGGGEIGLAASGLDEWAEIVVSDRGPGISPELRGDALRKYRRLEEARTTEGSGLGLAMARAAARLHGGDILLEDNRPGLRVRLVLRREPAHIADV
jgi:signal transduction histidine kinase